MIQLSNDDARTILQLLERAPAFYRNHAVKTKDINDGRIMAKMAKVLNKKLNLS